MLRRWVHFHYAVGHERELSAGWDVKQRSQRLASIFRFAFVDRDVFAAQEFFVVQDTERSYWLNAEQAKTYGLVPRFIQKASEV
jgi:ATP-dependent protease ClpP protease subunit